MAEQFDMNGLLRLAAGFTTGAPDGQNQPTVITSAQEERIAKYMALGESYKDARDLVLGALPAEKPPRGDAGAGRGDALPADGDMNNFIRGAAGYSRMRPGG